MDLSWDMGMKGSVHSEQPRTKSMKQHICAGLRSIEAINDNEVPNDWRNIVYRWISLLHIEATSIKFIQNI